MGHVILLMVLGLVPVQVMTFNIDLRFPHVYHSSQQGDYFGFNVALQPPTRGQNHSWMMVGAPKSKDPLRQNAKNSGRVMLCPFGQPCLQLTSTSPKVDRNENRDGSMLGSVQDISNGHWLSCAPRWMESSDTERYRIVGQCYAGDTNDIFRNKATTIRPLLDKDNYVITVGDNFSRKTTLAYFIYGQAGFSAHFPDEKGKTQIVLGAPGVLNWQGSTISYDFDHQISIIHNPHLNADIRSFGLFGYSISSGRFFHRVNGLLHVAGAPRAEQVGRVLLYSFPKRSHIGITSAQRLEGQQIGEYFGASLAVCDLNNDGFDDLVVGAPLFSTHEDEGRVFIYLANSNVRILAPSERFPEIRGAAIKGKFGTAISCIGDIDQDGYPDIAISAPYENGGVVYIYNGGPDGLASDKPSQIIEGSEILQDVSGFGYSLSRGQDMDGNGYNDLAIGAYRSGHVFLFRTRPVVEFMVQIFPIVEQSGLPRNSSRLQIKVCATYYGKSLTPTLQVTRRLVVDEHLKRVFLAQNSQIESSVVTLTRESNDVDNCRTIELSVKPIIQNFLLPIPVRVEYDILPDETNPQPVRFLDDQALNEGKDYFCADCPVMRSNNRNSAETQVLFATDCGSNNICNSHLVMNVQYTNLNGSSFIVGSSPSLSFRVTVSNSGEHPAYLTRAQLDLPVRALRLPPQCQESVEAQNMTKGFIVRINCDIANPLNPGMSIYRDLVLDMSGASATQGSLRVLGRATTSSNDDGSDAEAAGALALEAKADVSVLGKAMKEFYYFDTKAAKEDPKRNVPFHLIYQVEKIGVSRVDTVEVTIDVPVGLKSGKRFILLGQPELYLNSKPFMCNSDEGFTNLQSSPSNQGMIDPGANDGGRYKRQVMMAEKQVKSFPANRTLFVNCSNAQWQCVQIVCKDVGPFVEHVSSARLQLTMQVDTNVLESMLGLRDIISFATDAHVQISRPHSIQQPPDHLPDHAVVSATFIGRIPPSKVESWVLALSVIGGILLLLVLITGLIKAGFFERKQKDALIKLKRETQMDLAAMQRASMAQQQAEMMEDDEDE